MTKNKKFSKNSKIDKKLKKKNHGFLKEKRCTLRKKNSTIASD